MEFNYNKSAHKNMIKYYSTQNKYDCYGCRACEQICPKNAIKFINDEEGFLYPELNKNLCIDCGLCNKICPIETHNTTLTHQVETSIAAQITDKQILRESSSGGIFTLFASFILENSGTVYGAAYTKDMYVAHKRITSIKDLSTLRGSKYVQSDINDTYKQALLDLKKGIPVLFTGTPCQIHGLKLFLRKDYSNLFTIDLVCHGTPSYKLFQKTIHAIEKSKKSTITFYNFRDKNIAGWSCSSSSIIKKGNKYTYLKFDKNMDAYFKAFIGGDFMRYSCYKCNYANTNRPGDITLADCWGIRKIKPNFPNINNGVSLILINGVKGQELWEKVKCKTYHELIDLDYVVKSNPNLHRPTPMSEKRMNSYKNTFNNYNHFIHNYGSKNIDICIFYIKYYLKHSIFYRFYKRLKTV